MPRINTQAQFYRSVKSNDSFTDRYITFGSHATYQLNTGGISIWARRGTWRTDGENIVELIQFGTSYVRVAYTGSVVTVTAYANAATIASTSYTLPSSNISSWHNIVVTWDSSSMIVYFDTTAIITLAGDKRLSFSGNPSFYVGAGNAAGSGYFFDGWHTRAALYNAKLGVSDIEKIWLTESPSSEVAAWDYTDVSGSTITLTRGSGNNGTIIQGSIQLDVPYRPRIKSRTVPSSLGLTSGKIESASNCGITGSGAWTMGGWIFINKINGGGTGYDFPFATMGATAPYLGLDNGVFSIGHTALINSSTIKAQQYLGQWVHLAGSYSGGTNGTYKIFLNGKQVYSITYVGTPALANGKFAINNYLNSGLYQLYAQFSQVFCATSALTETEIYNLAYNISTPTLAVFWKLDETLGTSATDSSGNSNTGTITSGTWSGLNVPFVERTKVQNYPYSVLFNGSTQYGTATINFGSATKFVWHGWLKPTIGTTPQVFLSSDIPGQAFEIQYANAVVGHRKYLGLVGVTGGYNYWASEAVKENEWHRVTFVYDSSEGANTRTKIYIDGRLSGAIYSNIDVSPTLGNQSVEIATRIAAGIYGKGNMGPFRMYTGYAWTAEEVLKAHLQDIYPTSGTLIANIGMTDGNGTVVTDSSGNGNNFSLVNTPTWSSTDLPRKPRLQIPKQNLLIRSEEFDNASWTKNALTVSANAATAPDGTATADLCYPTSTGSARSAYQHVTKYKRGDYNTVSVYAKAAGLNYITFIDFFAGSFGTVWFNLSNGTIGTSAANYSGTILNVGNGWYRCTVKGFCTLTVVPYAQIIVCDADNSLTSTTNGTNGVYLWGAQWNTVSQATDYQATTSAAVNTGTPRTQIT